jgi:hypothetical protein
MTMHKMVQVGFNELIAQIFKEMALWDQKKSPDFHQSLL